MSSPGIPKKEDIREFRYWSVPDELQGHIFFFGRIGSGKTCKLLTIVQGYHAKKFKIWDYYGGKRGEGPFWALPNDDDALWKQMQDETYEFAETGPFQYNVKLVFPCFETKLPAQLPQNLPNVQTIVMPISILDTEEEDVSLAIGPLGPKAKAIWQEIKKLPKTASGPDIEFLMDTKFRKRKNDAIYTLFLKPAIDDKLFASAKNELLLDLIAEAEDRETITVLCLDYVPERFKLFIMGYLQRKVFTYAIEDKIHKKNIGLYREASAFMKVQDADKSKEDTTSIFRNQIVNIARYGRSGFFLAMDTQDSSEVKGMIEGSEDILGICEMPSPTSREVTCAPLKRDRRMNEAQIRYISTMPIHQLCVVTRGQRAVILKRVQPPRCKYFKSQYGSFYSLWRKEVNSWVSTSQFTSIMDQEYQRAEELLLPKRARLKALRGDSDDEDEDFEAPNEDEEDQVPEVIEEAPIIENKGGESDGPRQPGIAAERPERSGFSFNANFG